jgi:hypothetical protein
MQVRIKAQIITEALNGDNRTGNSFLTLGSLFEKQL